MDDPAFSLSCNVCCGPIFFPNHCITYDIIPPNSSNRWVPDVRVSLRMISSTRINVYRVYRDADNFVCGQVPRYYFGVNSVQELVPSSSSSRTASASNDHPARIDRSRHMHMGAQETRGVSVRVSGQAPPKRSLKNTRAHNAFTHQTSLSGWDGVVNLEAISPGRSFTESREAK